MKILSFIIFVARFSNKCRSVVRRTRHKHRWKNSKAPISPFSINSLSRHKIFIYSPYSAVSVELIGVLVFYVQLHSDRSFQYFVFNYIKQMCCVSTFCSFLLVFPHRKSLLWSWFSISHDWRSEIKKKKNALRSRWIEKKYDSEGLGNGWVRVVYAGK